VLALLLTACGGGSSSSSGTAAPPGSGGGGGGGNPPVPVETKVLFLGNSYTVTNGMPLMLELLAAERGRPVIKSVYAPGGTTLGSPQVGGHPHASDPTTLGLIAADTWDWVVLQEQSTTPTIPFTFESFMKTGAQSLDASIKANDPSTTTLLFQTWGRANGGQFCASGDCSPLFADFDAMQDALTAAYAEVGQLIGAPVAPVGEAWRLLRAQDPTLALHQADESHPTHEGSYLAACVLYAALFDESPEGIAFTSFVDPTDAAVLQRVAARAVFEPTCGIGTYDSGASPANTLALTVTGDPRPGESLTLTPDQVPETGWWCLSSSAPTNSELFGGAVLVDLTQPLFASAFLIGTTPAIVPIPAEPILAGFDMYFQALAPDSTQPGGYALSQGVRVEVCP
jgi:hypothetical protein